MKGIIADSLKKAAPEGGHVMRKSLGPRPSRILITRESKTTLEKLIAEGVNVPGVNGKVRVSFTQVGEPFPAREGVDIGKGWTAVRVRSSFGGASVLLLETHEGNRVSGMLRLRRGGKV